MIFDWRAPTPSFIAYEEDNAILFPMQFLATRLVCVIITMFPCSRYLLENGADVAAVNYDGELPVDIAESDTMGNLLQAAIDEKGAFNSTTNKIQK